MPGTHATATTFDLWGGSATVLVTVPDLLDDAVAEVRRTLAEVDRAASGHRGDSALSRLNASAGRTVVVDDLLFEGLQIALGAARWTDGLTDPTVGTVTLPDRALRQRPTAAPDWRSVRVDPTVRAVTVPAGTALDLGATGKGWAADLAAARAGAAVGPGCGVLVSLAGDLATAGPAPAGGWAVRVTDDHRSDPSDVALPGATVLIDGGALATSSTTVRRRRAGAESVAHVVDPRTWHPVESTWRTVTVAAASCATANAASTAALVRGADAPAWLGDLGLPGRLVATDGRVVTVGGWPTESAEDIRPTHQTRPTVDDEGDAR